MAAIVSDEGNVKLTLELLCNQKWDVEAGRSDGENWVPFLLSLDTPTLRRRIDGDATFTAYELKSLIQQSEEVLKHERKRVDFFTLEAYFEMIVEAVEEDDWIQVELWLKMGTVTSGKHVGYDEGCRFYTSREDFKRWIDGLKKELKDGYER